MEPSDVAAIMSGEDRSARGRFLRSVTRLVEPFFTGVVAARDVGFRRGWLRSIELPAPTISVGNLTTGGTGKTPVVRWLAERLRERGHRPAVLLRGYHADASGLSDEQRLLEQALSDGTAPVPVIANPDRVAGARRALQVDPKIDVFLLDDGFQHRRVRRDFDLVLVSGAQPFGYGHLLPRGLLREPVRSLRRADAVLITRASDAPPPALAEIERAIHQYRTGVPVFRSDHVHLHVQVCNTGEQQRLSLDALENHRLFVFCGIGDPQSLLAQFRRHGWNVGGEHLYRDHHRYVAADLRDLTHRYSRAGADRLVTTEKDWVKLSQMRLSDDVLLPLPPVYVIGLGVHIEDEAGLLAQVEDAIHRGHRRRGAGKSRTEEG